MDIYIDVYFCLNFLMDFVVLLITGKIIKNGSRWWRAGPAAFFGALYATGLLILGKKGVLTVITTYVIVAEIMLLLSFGLCNLKNTIKRILLLYFVTFVLSGMLNMLYYGCAATRGVMELAVESMFGNISISFILSVVLSALCIFSAVKERMAKEIRMSEKIFPVVVKVNSARIPVKALCDTGNSLYDPLTKKPVSVLEERCIRSLDTENFKYLMIPFHTIGKKGIMKAFIADAVEVNGKKMPGAVIGIYDGKLSQSGNYEMILHPEIIENRGEGDV